MEQIHTSDPTMIASNLFDKLINDVRSSGLNFRLELTPFGAKISLKKSLIKNMEGNVVIPEPPHSSLEALSNKNNFLENQIEALQFSMNNTFEELTEAQNKHN